MTLSQLLLLMIGPLGLLAAATLGYWLKRHPS